MKVIVYLAGDVSGGDRWRPKVVEACKGLNVEFLSPIDCVDYTLKSLRKANKKNRVFLHCDFMKCDLAHVIFAYIRKSASRHSGTSAEIGYAKKAGKLILLVNDLPEDEEYLYEFVKRAADEYFRDFDKGVDYLADFIEEMQFVPEPGNVEVIK